MGANVAGSDYSSLSLYITHAVIMKHSDQDLIEWVKAGGRACLTGYTELGSPRMQLFLSGKPRLFKGLIFFNPFCS